MPEEKALAHLESLRADVRDEIKKRIEQRDKYSIQLTIALGVILAVSFSQTPGIKQAIAAAPLISIYFTVLILYSYQVHSLLARYLRTVIEPQLAQLSGTFPEDEFETWYKRNAVPGIRKVFFLSSLWATYMFSLGYFLFTDVSESNYRPLFALLFATYIVAIVIITAHFLEVRFSKLHKSTAKQ